MEKRIDTARSQSDGIVFYSNQTPFLGVRSMITEDGEYIAGMTFILLEDIFGFLGGDKLRKYILDQKTIRRLNLLLILLSFMTMDLWIILGTMYFTFFAGKHVYQLISFVIALKLGDARNVARFHSAEHMAINAYNTLQRIPTMEEIKSYSRFSNECGSRTLIRQSLIYTIISLEIMILGRMSGVIYISALIVTSLVFYLVGKLKLYRYIQILVTNKPTDVELKVAYNGVVAFDKMESDFESECCNYFIIDL